MRNKWWTCSVLLLMWPLVMWADDPNQEVQDQDKLDISGIMSSMVMSGGPMGGSGAAKLPDFKDVTKGMVSKGGMFTLWSYPPNTPDKDSEKLLCQIPASLLGQNFMLSTSFSGGGFFTGFPIDQRVVRWELLNNQLILIEPETHYVIDGNKEVSDAVKRTYPERIRTSVSVVTKSPSGDPVIDLGPLLKSEFADISWMTLFNPTGGSISAGINSSLSKWTKKKAFPQNVEIGVELAIRSVGPFVAPGSHEKKMVHYSFWMLPQSSYQPRVADDRIGYFLTANQDWSKPTSSRDLFNRYIDRWHLEKRDPSLALCEPKTPIVFYIEKTVPVRFRRAVRDGILEWNRAFEEIGFLNAIEVRQQEKDNEWRDLDPEDMRYSFFRWIVTGAGFAMGPHRSNPFTGQIYDADIIFDDSMVRYFEREADLMLGDQALAMKKDDPAVREFLSKYPAWDRTPFYSQHVDHSRSTTRDQRQLRDRMIERMRHTGHHNCDYMQGMQHQMSVAGAMLADRPEAVKEKFLYDVIKEVVMHEVGHTLGLRHNFKASSIYTLDEIKERCAANQATVGSVMDYNPVYLDAEHIENGAFMTETIGPYDYWAIEYGYRPADGSYQAPTTEALPEAQEAPAELAATEPVLTQTAEIKIDASQVKDAIKQIPPEMLAQMPPEIKKMIESGDLQGLMGMAGSVGAPSSTPVTPTAKPSGPAFKAPPSGEAGMLQAIASRSAEPELAYATDEDTTFLGVDPASNRFDLAKCPVSWAKEQISHVDKRMSNILEWAVKDQESWYHLRSAYVRLLIEKVFVLDYVGRYIGGQYFSRSHRGDANADTPFVLVDAKTQREALEFISETLYQDDFFNLSPDVLKHLAPSRWWHQGTSMNFNVDFPIHEYVALFQWWNLFDRMYPDTLRRIHDAELKSDASDKFTVAEYIQRVQEACWGETLNTKNAKSRSWSDSKPYITDVSRSLQREYLGIVEPLVRFRPGTVMSPDLHAMVRHSVRRLGNNIAEVLSTKRLDFASEAHLTDAKSRIDRMLSAELSEYN